LCYSSPEIYRIKTFSGLLSPHTTIVNVAIFDLKPPNKVAGKQSELKHCIHGCNASREG